MKKFFVIQCDTEDDYVFVKEVTRTFTKTVEYRHEAGDVPVVSGRLSPKFYGRLDALLITSDKVEQAAPIVPVTEAL